MTNAAIDCMIRLGGSLNLYDQTILNIMFRNAWLPLSPRWNFPTTAFETDVEALIRPVLYHHMWAKPWKFGHASRREVAHFREAIRKTPYRDFKERLSPRQVKRLAENRVKELIQYATFFLPSSYERIQARSRSHIQRAAAKHVIENVRSRRFADVDQNISVIDVAALSSLFEA